MADLVRFGIDGYGQVELNNVAFRRDGRIEAQCKLDPTDFADKPCENGMLLAVDNVTRTVKFPNANNIGRCPIALVYSSEHMYDERANGLKDFKLEKDTFLPRLGYLAVGDKFTTNCISYNTDDGTNIPDDQTLKHILELTKLLNTPVYGVPCENGGIRIDKDKPTSGLCLRVIKATTMPDGQYGIKFQVLSV